MLNKVSWLSFCSETQTDLIHLTPKLPPRLIPLSRPFASSVHSYSWYFFLTEVLGAGLNEDQNLIDQASFENSVFSLAFLLSLWIY